MSIVGLSPRLLVFLGLSVLELGPMYATDRRQTKATLNASAVWERRHNKDYRVTAVNCIGKIHI